MLYNRLILLGICILILRVCKRFQAVASYLYIYKEKMRYKGPKVRLIRDFLEFISPAVIWVDKTFTVPFSKKKITGEYYFKHRDKFQKGTIFLTNTYGVGSNLLNPSEINHGGIYFGKGLKTHIFDMIETLEKKAQDHANPNAKKILLNKIDRLHQIILKYHVCNDINYVIEATGEGCRPTDLVTFMTTKDVFIATHPRFTDADGMVCAARNAVNDLGLPYDYGFHPDNSSKYCFEVLADAYEGICLEEEITTHTYSIFGIWKYNVYLSTSFTDEKWKVICDSRKSL